MLTSPSISARHLLVLEAVTAIAYVASAIACDWHDNAVPWSASATVVGLFAAGLLVRKTDRSLDAPLAAALIGAVLLRVIGLIFQLRDLFRNQFPRCERGSCFASRARDGDAWFCYESEARCVSHNPDSPACTAMCSNLETDGGPVELTCYVYFSRYDGGARRLGFESEQACDEYWSEPFAVEAIRIGLLCLFLGCSLQELATAHAAMRNARLAAAADATDQESQTTATPMHATAVQAGVDEDVSLTVAELVPRPAAAAAEALTRLAGDAERPADGDASAGALAATDAEAVPAEEDANVPEAEAVAAPTASDEAEPSVASPIPAAVEARDW